MEAAYAAIRKFWPAHKATRRVAAGQNVAEKNRTKAVG
jgi:hypothetical protein